jgi:hypothetical protein
MGSGAPDLVTLSLPALKSFGLMQWGSSPIFFPVLSTFSVPMLTSVVGITFECPQTPPLTSLDFPSLTSVLPGGGLLIVCTTATSFSVNAPKLQTASELAVVLSAPFNIQFPALTHAGSLQVDGPPSASFSVPALTSVGGPGGIAIGGGVSIDAPQIASCTGPLSVADGATLVTLPVLASVGDFSLEGGVALSLPVLKTAGNLNVGIASDTAKYNPWMVNLPLLTTVVSLNFAGPGPGDLSLPSLTSVSPGGVSFAYNPNQPSLVETSTVSAPLLKTIAGNLSVIGYAPTSGSLIWPALTSIGGSITMGISNCACPCPYAGALSSLHFPLLVTLGANNSGTLDVGSSMGLPLACFQGLVQQLQQAGWTGMPIIPSTCISMGPCP